MNLVEMICEELGIELEEEWVGNDGNYYKISNSGELLMISYFDDLEESVFEYIDDISKVLVGELKPKWKPKYREEYYMPQPTHKEERHRFMKFTFSNHSYDKWAFKNNLVFKTKDEAINCANEMIALAKNGI